MGHMRNFTLIAKNNLSQQVIGGGRERRGTHAVLVKLGTGRGREKSCWLCHTLFPEDLGGWETEENKSRHCFLQQPLIFLRSILHSLSSAQQAR